jgi:ribosomal protein L7/L12
MIGIVGWIQQWRITMKLDKVRFATLIGFISRTAGVTFSISEIVEIDDIIDMPIPEAQKVQADPVELNTLMGLMNEGALKIGAIKSYRTLTGMGLKESKDAVERYWGDSPEAKLLARIRQALGTNADGNELVAVAKAAYRNGEELASYHNDEGATLGDILGKTRPKVNFDKFEG